MVGSDFMDEIDCGSFFDQIDDIIEFPADNGCGLGSSSCNDFRSIWSNPLDVLSGSAPIFSGNDSNGASDLSAELSYPCEDIVNLDWFSNFVDDSLSGGVVTLDKENSPGNKESSHSQFQTSSPVSALESSSSSSSFCSGGKIMPLGPTQHGPQRARSKRSRPTTFNPRPAIQLISPTSESENFAESPRIKKTPKSAAAEQKKKKKMKLSIPLASVEMNQNPAPSVRKCMHCEITKTPQWRAGPMGPKTLCNACGVRYKSDRLFPEYRPAASPTFLPSLHSNSHKKVLEMRIKGAEKSYTVARVTEFRPCIDRLELVPSSNPSPDYI